MISKLLTHWSVLGAFLLAIANTAYADDPAYYKLTEVEELTIYKEGETELRPTFSFETVAFGHDQSRVGKKDQFLWRVRQALVRDGGDSRH